MDKIVKLYVDILLVLTHMIRFSTKKSKHKKQFSVSLRIVF